MFIINPYFGSASTGFSNSYWASQYSSGTTNARLGNFIPGPDGSVFMTGFSTTPGPSTLLLVKADYQGNTLWTSALTSSTYTLPVRGVNGGVDSSGNSYIAGQVTNTTNFAILAKYNPSGTLLWQKRMTGVGVGLSIYDMTTDSAGNSYLSGYNDNTGAPVTIKVDTSGAPVFYKRLSVGAASSGLSYDSSGNVYSAANTCIYKLSSTGTLLGCYQLSSTSSVSISSIKVGSDNSIYIAGAFVGTDSFVHGYVLKLNSSFAIQWQKELYNGTSHIGVSSVTVDSSGNVYTSSADNSSIGYAILHKFNSSGTVQWARHVTSLGAYDRTLSIRGLNNLLIGITPTIPGDQGVLLGLSVPTDGANTGTFTLNGVSRDYATSTLLTVATPSISIGALGATVSDIGSFSIVSGDFGSPAAGLTNYKVTL